jgi:ribonuclease T2
MKSFGVFLTIVVLFLGVSDAGAKKRHKGGQSHANFDYYLLSLSWAPEYCAGHPNDNSAECKTGNKTGFVLHGLWPQSNAGQPPMNCGPVRPVAADIVRRMRQYFPSASLIQHEWAKHGTCSGLSAADYFAKVEQAFKAVQPPAQFRDLTQDQSLAVGDLEANFASANHAPAEAFRTSCHSKELVSVDVCMTKDLQFQACSKSVRECPVTPVLVRAPK